MNPSLSAKIALYYQYLTEFRSLIYTSGRDSNRNRFFLDVIADFGRLLVRQDRGHSAGQTPASQRLEGRRDHVAVEVMFNALLLVAAHPSTLTSPRRS